MSNGVVIIGAGHAGVQAAGALRQAGYASPIKLISAESTLPYHRPPLSKALLLGEKVIDQIYLRKADFYQSNNIELQQNCVVEKIDAVNKRIISAQASFEYEHLILATGCRARELPELAQYTNVLSLRSIEDANKILSQLANAKHITLIGGGFIGLEVAASARLRGINVDIIESQSRLLKRALPETLAEFMLAKHQAEGVNIHLNTAIKNVHANDACVTQIELSNEETIQTDMVLICIGDSPDIDLASSLELRTELGAIYVNKHLQTSSENIYAIGDCTSFILPLNNQITRLASVQNAVDQGKVVANNIVGNVTEYNPVPWFWSDQYNLKLQIAGLSAHDTELLTRGSIDAEKFSLLEHKEGKLIAVYTLNNPADHIAARALIKDQITLNLERSVDIAIPLKECGL